MDDEANSSPPYLNGRPSAPHTNEDDDNGRKQTRTARVVPQETGEYVDEDVRNLHLPWL
jgi:hypothetical protein